MTIERVASLYRQAFAEHGRSLNAIFIPKGRQRERFEALTQHIAEDGFSILDFGCGLGDLRTYLATRFHRFDYTGVDIMEGFVESNREVHPAGKFIHIRDFADIDIIFDYVMISGTFNINYFKDETENFQYARNALRHLWSKTKIALSVDFMHTDVDYRQPNAYHQNPIQLLDFLRKELSPLVKLDFTYLPYEFCAVIFRD